MRIRQEFLLSEMSEYIDNNITLVIANDSSEERKKLIYNTYFQKGKNIITICYNNNKFLICNPRDRVPTTKCASHSEIASVIKSFPNIDWKNVLIDMTSLSHVSLACLLKAILIEMKPAKVFMAYVKPEKYVRNSNNEYDFSVDISAPKAIPGYATHSKDNQILVPFLGFEGKRLLNIMGEELYSEINPVLGFPSADPLWQFETLRYCKDTIQEKDASLNIRKCKADSIYDAYYELEDIMKDAEGRQMVIAPLGTRPHFVAAILFAIRHRNNCKIIFDNVKEKSDCTEGIRDTIIYHISTFIGDQS